METERFEGKIKRELRDREITPSAGSWDKLSARLAATQEKKRPLVLWMGIAASIIGGILILSLVFNNSIPSDSPEIVDVPKNEVKLEKTPVETSEEILIETQKEKEQFATEEVEVVKREAKTPSSKDEIEETESSPNNREAIAVIDNMILLKDHNFTISSDKILDVKLNDAVASVLTQTKNGQAVTDAEVNKLLAEAASGISLERYKTGFAVGKVDPQDLLQAVELEIDNSFRDKIFDMLKEGYSKAKTAVANRNY